MAARARATALSGLVATDMGGTAGAVGGAGFCVCARRFAAAVPMTRATQSAATRASAAVLRRCRGVASSDGSDALFNGSPNDAPAFRGPQGTSILRFRGNYLQVLKFH